MNTNDNQKLITLPRGEFFRWNQDAIGEALHE